MISPHLLKVVSSYSTSLDNYKNDSAAKLTANELFGLELPILILERKTKHPKWCHMVFARGPALDPRDGAEHSQLVIIWWSEMSPDTERVLSAVDWEKHAKNV